MDNQLNSGDESAAKQVAVEGTKQKQMELEAGVFGKLFGSNSSTPTHIAGAVVLILTGAGILYSFIYGICPFLSSTPNGEGALPPLEMWKTISPIISTCLAYIFGASTKRSGQ